MIFVDASGWIAALHRRDQNHQRAKPYLAEAMDQGERLLTTNWTAYEAYSYLKSHAGYNYYLELFAIIKNPHITTLERVTEEIEDSALEIFHRYRDKTWGIVDCANLIIMELSGCDRAFAYDKHFCEAARQYGFKVEG